MILAPKPVSAPIINSLDNSQAALEAALDAVILGINYNDEVHLLAALEALRTLTSTFTDRLRDVIRTSVHMRARFKIDQTELSDASSNQPGRPHSTPLLSSLVEEGKMGGGLVAG
jgi:hypothetical protein